MTDNNSHPIPLNLENHCLFCLQPQKIKTLLEVARRNPKLRKNPSPIIRYLTGTDQSCGRSDEEYESMMGVAITTRFPSMTCAACYEILEELCRLHEKLLEVQRMIQKEAELARELIIKSQEASSSAVSYRQEFYSKIQSSKMPDEQIRTVAMFVDNFHSTLVFEASANHNAELPSGSDPDLVSNTVFDHAAAPDNSKQNVEDFEMMKLQYSKTNLKFEYEQDDADNDVEDLLKEFNDFKECSNSKNADADSSSNECDLGNRNIDDYVPSSPDQLSSSSSSSSCSSSSYSPLPKKRIRKKQSTSTRPKAPRTRKSTRIKSTSSEIGSNSTEIAIAELPKVMKRPKRRTLNITSQHCDICGEWCRFPDLRNHLEGTHNVQDFITECPNSSCPYIFSCRGKMEKHVVSFPHCRNIANLPKIFKKCETCNLDIHKTTFLNHLNKHEKQVEDKVMSCPIPGCSDQYALRQSLEEHLSTHDRRISGSKRPKQQECSICMQLLKVGNVKKHLQEVHEVKEVISCRRCPFLFHNWESLLDHLEKHGLTHRSIGGGQLVCGICNDGIKFRRYDTFRQHFFNLHKIGKNYYCEFCGSEFFSQTTLSLHKQKCQSSSGSDKLSTVTPKTAKPNQKSFLCDQCPDSRFQNKRSLQNHKIKEHGADPVACKFCGDTFTAMFSLAKHERTHLGLVHTYKCRVESCGKMFRKIDLWKDHELSAHNTPGVKLVVCEICGKGFKSRLVLYSHKRTVHDKIKGPRRICEVCGESFTCLSSLKRHNLIHTGARPHPCPICGQAFRHREVLKTHIKSHQEKGDNFKPNGPMKNIRKRVVNATKTTPTK